MNELPKYQEFIEPMLAYLAKQTGPTRFTIKVFRKNS
jgi:hypothetical protein